MTDVIPSQDRGGDAQLDSDGMHRGVGFIGLLWASEGSIIGSGWLFGALTAAAIAGPSAIIAWVIASVMVIQSSSLMGTRTSSGTPVSLALRS